jgi:predicted RNA-binding protein with TRAM domain
MIGLDTVDGSLGNTKKNSLAESSHEHHNRFSNKRSVYHSSFQYPVKIGDEYDVSIEDMSRNGDSGVTRIGGLITFVTGTKPDDRARIKITKVGKGYARGQLIAYLDTQK